MGWGQSIAVAGGAALLSACVGAPEPQAAAPQPEAVCHALFEPDPGMAMELAHKGSDVDTLCRCFVLEHAELDPDTQATMMDLSIKLIEMHDELGLSTVEEAVELMEDDRDGEEYGFEWDGLKAGGEPIEDAIIRSLRKPQTCPAP